MARPKKETVDYFPHFTNSGKTLYILEGEFGNDGYAFWFKLLELLGSSDGHVYNCRNTPSWKFLLAKTKVDEDTASKILDTLAELEAIDQELWKYKVIWSDNFVDNLQPVYSNRKTQLPNKPIITSNNDSTDELLPVETEESELTMIKNLQSKVKESKVKDSIEKNNKEEKETGSSNSYPQEVTNNFSNQKLSIIANAYEQNGLGPLSPIVQQELIALLDEYDTTWINEAIKIVVTSNKRNLKYVKGILKNWRTNGGMTLVNDTQAVKKPNSIPRKKTRFHTSESRTDKYSEQQLEEVAKQKRLSKPPSGSGLAFLEQFKD